MNNQNKNFTGLNKPAAAAAAEPAKRLLVVAERNGWSVQIDPELACRKSSYVYTDADELAAAVRGLVENGTPLKTARQLGILSGIAGPYPANRPLLFRTVTDYQNEIEIGRLQDELLRLEEWNNTQSDVILDQSDENVRLSRLIHERAVDYEKGRADGRNEFLGRQPWREIDELTKTVKRLTAENERIVADAVQCHKTNNELISERKQSWEARQKLQAENDRLEEGLAKLLRDAQLLRHG